MSHGAIQGIGANPRVSRTGLWRALSIVPLVATLLVSIEAVQVATSTESAAHASVVPTFSMLAAGDAHTCGLDVGVGVACWGANNHGQLGDTKFNQSSTPVAVVGVAGSDVSRMVSGANHVCVLTGSNNIVCWGANGHGQLGSGTFTEPVPGQQAGQVAVAGTVLENMTIAEIAAGGDHTCAITTEGPMACWGDNSSGQLGDGTTTDSAVPVAVAITGSALDGASYFAVVGVGATHSCALGAIANVGVLGCWGGNAHGQLGDGTTTASSTPVAVLTPGTVLENNGYPAVVASGDHSCGLIGEGIGGACWGDNGDGEFANGSTVDAHQPVDVSVDAYSHALGASHICALGNTAVLCWGGNGSGQLGDGTTTDSGVPVEVVGAGGPLNGGGRGVLASGRNHTCLARDDATTVCWGSNTFGQLGNNTMVNSSIPVTVISTPPITAPGQPTGVTAVAGNGQATVSWTAPASDGGSPITSYSVGTYAGGVFVDSRQFDPTATTRTITGLTNGTSYTFVVAAGNDVEGLGSDSDPSNAVVPFDPVTLPGTPTGVTAVRGDQQATVSWIAPVADGGAAITGYVVTPFIGAVAQPATTFATADLSGVVVGLTNGTSYTFKVAAINSVGTGIASALSAAVIPAGVPAAPTSAAAVAAAASATVTWIAPTSTGGSAITGYVITPFIGAVAQTAVASAGTATTRLVTGLTNGTVYTFTVAAKNVIGAGAASGPTSEVTPTGVPGAPTIGAVVAGNQQVSVSWTAPSATGGSPITAYTITPMIGAVAQTPQVFGPTATTQTVIGLSNGTSYKFKVAATNAVGTGTASGLSATAIPATVPGAPTIGTATASVVGSAASVTWTAPASTGGSAITGYVVTPYIGTVAQPTRPFGAMATTGAVTGLVNGTTYTFTVAATNAKGTSGPSAPSNAVTPVYLALPPTNVAAVAGATQVTVSWTAPTNVNGSPVTGYAVATFIGASTTAASTQTFTSPATSQVITGLTNGTSYRFKVASINAVGTSALSGFSSTVVPATTPGVPTLVAVAGNANVVLTWTAPTSTGGLAITGYVITPYIGATAQPVKAVAATATTTTVTGLVNGTAYTFTIAATNAVGTGAPSLVAGPVTPLTVASAPTIGLATASSGRAVLSWAAPTSTGGSPITGYIVTPYVGTSSQITRIFDTTATTQAIEFLVNGTSYRFKVAAVTAAGTGAMSGFSNTVLPAALPGVPTFVSATAGNLKATVTWTAPTSNGGAAITGYRVYTKTPTFNPVTGMREYLYGSVTYTSTATTQIVPQLANGRVVQFSIAAINPAGTGPASVFNGTVVPGTVPGAPTIGSAVGGVGQATVTWTPPITNGGAAITKYVVTPYRGSTAQTSVTVASNVTQQVIGGLTNAVYTFKVTAVNSWGNGAASAGSNAVTPITSPGAPTIGIATAADASATIRWTAPTATGGSPITGYAITPYAGATALTPTIYLPVGATRQAIVPGLTNLTGYTFTVAAVNAAGTGLPSAASAAVVPTHPPFLATSITTGGFHSCAVVKPNSTLMCWGANSVGQLGNGTTNASASPVAVTTAGTPLAGKVVAQVVSGLFHTCARTTDQVVACWGLMPLQYHVPTLPLSTALAGKQIVDMVTGERHTCALTSDGAAFCWGYNTSGQLGTGGDLDSPAWGPERVVTLGTPLAGQPILSIAAGGNTTCARSATTLACWGANSAGQLGNGTQTSSSVPVAVAVAGSDLDGQSITKIVVGAKHACALGSAGTLACWGQNYYGQFGNGNNELFISTPTAAALPSGFQVTGLAAGDLHTCAIDGTGQVWCWGANYDGQIGDSGCVGDPCRYLVPTMVLVAGSPLEGATVSKIVSGFKSTCALTTDGTVGCWGMGLAGQLGNKPTASTSVPVAPSFGPPGAPTITDARAANGSVTVTWAAPTINVGLPVIGYVVTPLIGGTAQVALSRTVYYTAPSASTTLVVSGLSNQTTYTFRVAAINTQGIGAPSGDSGMVTPYVGVPAAPTIGTATRTNVGATVAWSFVGQTAAQFVVTPYIGSTAQTPVTVDGTLRTGFLTDLDFATAYTFTVAATNDAGLGPTSAQSNVVGARNVLGPAVIYEVISAPTDAFGRSGTIRVTFGAPDLDLGVTNIDYECVVVPAGIVASVWAGSDGRCQFWHPALTAGLTVTVYVRAYKTIDGTFHMSESTGWTITIPAR